MREMVLYLEVSLVHFRLQTVNQILNGIRKQTWRLRISLLGPVLSQGLTTESPQKKENLADCIPIVSTYKLQGVF